MASGRNSRHGLTNATLNSSWSWKSVRGRYEHVPNGIAAFFNVIERVPRLQGVVGFEPRHGCITRVHVNNVKESSIGSLTQLFNLLERKYSHLARPTEDIIDAEWETTKSNINLEAMEEQNQQTVRRSKRARKGTSSRTAGTSSRDDTNQSQRERRREQTCLQSVKLLQKRMERREQKTDEIEQTLESHTTELFDTKEQVNAIDEDLNNVQDVVLPDLCKRVSALEADNKELKAAKAELEKMVKPRQQPAAQQSTCSQFNTMAQEVPLGVA